MTYTTATDAQTALINSGVFEWFDFEQGHSEDQVAQWMYENKASADQAAEHFGVA